MARRSPRQRRRRIALMSRRGVGTPTNAPGQNNNTVAYSGPDPIFHNTNPIWNRPILRRPVERFVRCEGLLAGIRFSASADGPLPVVPAASLGGVCWICLNSVRAHGQVSESEIRHRDGRNPLQVLLPAVKLDFRGFGLCAQSKCDYKAVGLAGL